MAEKIIVLAEVQNGALRKNTPQLVDVARRLKSNAESRIILVLAGPKIESVATEAAGLPVDQVVRLEHDQAWQGTSEEILETLHAARQELKGISWSLGIPPRQGDWPMPRPTVGMGHDFGCHTA
ncbi:MAG: hypothetical protein IPI28_18725 [Candidatus Omnitrophica bacterium]|nr:hypothetical protein [Candidatus Omnitrophota bacterium]